MDAQHLILWAVVLANLLCFPFFAYLLLVAVAALTTKADGPASRLPASVPGGDPG